MGDEQQQCNIDMPQSENVSETPLSTCAVSELQMRRDRKNEIQKKFNGTEKKFNEIEKKFNEIEKKFNEIQKKFNEIQKSSCAVSDLQMQRDRNNEIEEKFNEIEKKFNEIKKKFNEIEKKFNEIEKKFNEIEKKFKKIQKSSCAVSNLQMQLAQSDEHKNLEEILDVYLSMKNGSVSRVSMEIQDNDNPIFTQVTPSGNTVLHIAAMYGNHEWIDVLFPKPHVAKTLQNAQNLLTKPNANGDTPLHFAARTQHISILHKLFTAHLSSFSFPLSNDATMEFETTLLLKNNQGNSFFHEALYNGQKDVMSLLFSDQKFDIDAAYKEDLFHRIAITQTNNEDKSVLYLAVEFGYKEIVDKVLVPKPHVVAGKSPLLAAIFKRDQDFVKNILERVPEWIHLKDKEGRTALHHAASIGYLDGVTFLLEKWVSLASIPNKDGFFPLHFASNGGHVEVVERLLQSDCCPYPGEILDNLGRNILHIAIQNGKFNVVKYILQSSNKELEKMINDKDNDGNTPLHYASLRCYPRIAYELIRDKRVKSYLVNNENHNALVACMESHPENLSLRQRLTWIVLKSAGLKPEVEPQQQFTTKAPSKTIKNYWELHKAPKMDNLKERISTLLLVSTLITTAAFAAGFTMPGGINSSDPGKGMSLLLDHAWFHTFIFSITISMYGGISATIILIFAQLGEISLAVLSLKVAMPILGFTLGTLSVAFLAGVHLVITDLTWLATTSMVLGVIFIVIVLSLYFLLWLPMSSSFPIFRYLSKYPILLLAFLVDKYETSRNSKTLAWIETVHGNGLGS